jgi:hypothetical protein
MGVQHTGSTILTVKAWLLQLLAGKTLGHCTQDSRSSWPWLLLHIAT